MVKILRVCVSGDHALTFQMSDHQWRVIDCAPFLTRGAFRRLADPRLFRQAYVAFDTVCWPGELDIAPETLLSRSTPVDGPPEADGAHREQ